MKPFCFSLQLAANILLASSLSADDALVDDFSSGSSENYFGYDWYYFDDNCGVKKDDRPQAGASTTPSVILVPYKEKNREALGNKNDTWKVKDYTFTVASDATGKFATMPFKYGSTWTASYGDALPYVGIGTMLAPEGKSIDLTGATAISFRIRSRKQELTVDFRVEQEDITKDSTFAFYQTSIPVTTQWASKTIELNTTTLAQPGWTPTTGERSFDIKHITKIAWEVHGGKNKTIKTGDGDTLDLDDIKIIGDYEFVSPSVWTQTAPLGQTEGLFANFEGDYPDATPLRTYFYAYDDHEIKGTSEVTSGATRNETTGLLKLEWKAGTGSDNQGKAAFLDYKLGKSVKQYNPAMKDSVNVQGFVGIGFNVYDSATATYFNATTGKRGESGPGGSTDRIYFEYLFDADAEIKYMTLEVSDINDVGDKDNPTRKESRGQGIVYYRNLPQTKGNWKAVSIKFSDLIVHDDWQGYTEIPLDITKLAKIQFKVQGPEDKRGILMIDNICFPGLNPIRVSRNYNGFVTSSGLRSSYRNNAVNIIWNNVGNINGKISLFNTKGAVVGTVPAETSGSLIARIPAGNLPAGMYFVKFNGTAGAKTVTQSNAVTIVK